MDKESTYFLFCLPHGSSMSSSSAPFEFDSTAAYDNELAVYRVSGSPKKLAQVTRDVIVQDGQVWQDMTSPSVTDKVREGLVGGIFHYGGKHQMWAADTWDGTDATKPQFHALDPLDPTLFYKASDKGLPVPFEQDVEGNVYLVDTNTPGKMSGPLATQPGTYYFDGDASFDRVLGPDDPDQAILLLSRGQKPEVVEYEKGASYTYDGNNFVDINKSAQSSIDDSDDSDDSSVFSEDEEVSAICTIL